MQIWDDNAEISLRAALFIVTALKILVNKLTTLTEVLLPDSFSRASASQKHVTVKSVLPFLLGFSSSIHLPFTSTSTVSCWIQKCNYGHSLGYREPVQRLRSPGQTKMFEYRQWQEILFSSPKRADRLWGPSSLLHDVHGVPSLG
jgi:hypothetical protein